VTAQQGFHGHGLGSPALGGWLEKAETQRLDSGEMGLPVSQQSASAWTTRMKPDIKSKKLCPHSGASDTISQPRLPASASPQNGPLAQLVEHRTFNPGVAGSTPARPTFSRHKIRPSACSEGLFAFSIYFSFPKLIKNESAKTVITDSAGLLSSVLVIN
jgi:hypothetical protein